MGILKRDLAAYQTALDAYNRKLHGYNSGVAKYNDSLVLDANGNPLIAQSQTISRAELDARIARGEPASSYFNYFSVDDQGHPRSASLPTGVDPRRVTTSALGEDPNYYLVRQADPGSQLPTKPGEWTQTFDAKTPDPTKAQIRRESEPSLAQAEGGLIGDVIRGSGVRYGVIGSPVSRRTGTADQQPSDPETTYDPYNPW